MYRITVCYDVECWGHIDVDNLDIALVGAAQLLQVDNVIEVWVKKLA